jgi:hypothetical protein
MPTAQEIIEAKQEEIANARLIAKRFPDARQVGDDWESESVNRERMVERNTSWTDFRART